jgi:hypothetical protein
LRPATSNPKKREREVDAHVAAGEITVHHDGAAMLDYLNQLDQR